MNTAEQKRHLGGAETEAKLAERHARYLTYHQPGAVEMLRVSAEGEVVGSVGYWEINRNGAPAYEVGWEILVAQHGRGYGSEAARMLIGRLSPAAAHRHLFAFPTPDNPGSNGICRRLGFDLLAVEQMEYPKDVFAPHNVWRLDLRAFARRRQGLRQIIAASFAGTGRR